MSRRVLACEEAPGREYGRPASSSLGFGVYLGALTVEIGSRV